MSFKKVETEDTIKNTEKLVFTYQVSMIVSVFAENEEDAKSKLDTDGGFVSNRVIDLKDKVQIYSPQND